MRVPQATPSQNASKVVCKTFDLYRLMKVARKVIRIIGDVEEKDILNEVAALDTLCSRDGGKVLVKVFNHSRGTGGLSPYDLYQIDMELCSKSLKHEIQEQRFSLRYLVQQVSDGDNLDLRVESPSKLQELESKCLHVVHILRQTLEGLAFIHSLSQVHRDLKPENGVHRCYLLTKC